MAYQPIADCIRTISAETSEQGDISEKPYVIYMSPQGKPFNQKKAQQLLQSRKKADFPSPKSLQYPLSAKEFHIPVFCHLGGIE